MGQADVARSTPLRVQTAWAGSRTKASYFRAQFRRLSRRRAAKPTAMAVGHSQLGVACQMLKRGTTFAALGVDHFDRHDAGRQKRQLIKKLEQLGCKVTVEATAA